MLNMPCLPQTGCLKWPLLVDLVQEYQIDVNPELMRQYDISLQQVVMVDKSNRDIGAQTLKSITEYLVRGLGYVSLYRI